MDGYERMVVDSRKVPVESLTSIASISNEAAASCSLSDWFNSTSSKVNA